MPIDAPAQVRNVEFSSLQLVLQFEVDFVLTRTTLLQLRREFRSVLDSWSVDAGHCGESRRLIEPADFCDPVARRRFRKPGPGFVLQQPLAAPRHLLAGDELSLTVHFLGKARVDIPLFIELFAALGKNGLSQGHGAFTLLRVENLLPASNQATLWVQGEPFIGLSTPYQQLGEWLDQFTVGGSLVFQLQSPTRLLKQAKPLFCPSLSELFPFALRRVTSMLYAWGDCEIDTVDELLQAASSVDTFRNDLKWKDWRVLTGNDCEQRVGGVTGQLEMTGARLREIAWVFYLLCLFNLGKGAAYGAGQCFVSS